MNGAIPRGPPSARTENPIKSLNSRAPISSINVASNEPGNYRERKGRTEAEAGSEEGILRRDCGYTGKKSAGIPMRAPGSKDQHADPLHSLGPRTHCGNLWAEKLIQCRNTI